VPLYVRPCTNMNCDEMKIEFRVRLLFALKGGNAVTPLRRYAVTPLRRYVVHCSGNLRLEFGAKPGFRSGSGDGAQTAAMQASSSASDGHSTMCSDEYLYRCMRGDLADLLPGQVCVCTCAYMCACVHQCRRSHSVCEQELA
jgi:hypothetical protein